MAATIGAGLKGLNSTTFLCGGKRSQALLSAATVGSKVGGASPTPKRFIMVAAAANKSWNPTVKGGGNFIDPEWLDGSFCKTQMNHMQQPSQLPYIRIHHPNSLRHHSHPTVGARRKLGVIVDFSDESAHAVRWAVDHYIRLKDAVILGRREKTLRAFVLRKRHGWLAESLRISRRACDSHIQMPFRNFHRERRSDLS